MVEIVTAWAGIPSPKFRAIDVVKASGSPVSFAKNVTVINPREEAKDGNPRAIFSQGLNRQRWCIWREGRSEGHSLHSWWNNTDTGGWLLRIEHEIQTGVQPLNEENVATRSLFYSGGLTGILNPTGKKDLMNIKLDPAR